MKTYKEMINSNPIVLIEFFASWCPHCLRMKPLVESITKDYNDKISVITLDVDKFESITEENEINTYPTFLIYKNGELLWRKRGEVSQKALEMALNSAIEQI